MAVIQASDTSSRTTYSKPNTPYRSICHSFDAGILLPVLGKPEVLMSDVGQSSKRLYADPQIKSIYLSSRRSYLTLITYIGPYGTVFAP